VKSIIHFFAVIAICCILFSIRSASAQAQTSVPTPASILTPAAVEIGSRRELFVDSLLIDVLRGARIQLEQPRDEGVMLRFDKAWEGPLSGYTTVVRDKTRFRLYYRAAGGAESKDKLQATCYAESIDGIVWVKPDFDFFVKKRADGGVPRNNVIIAGEPTSSANFTPLLDARPNVPAKERFKALAGEDVSALFAWVSPDGIKWSKLRTEPVMTDGAFDSQNVSFWSEAEQQYVCYLRMSTGVGKTLVRRVGRATSKDFLTWSKPVMMDYDSYPSAPTEEIYINQTQPYFRAPHLYVALGARFMADKQALLVEQLAGTRVIPDYADDCSEPVLLTTRAGSQTYQRTCMEAVVPPTLDAKTWTSRVNFPACGVIQTSPTEMSFYLHRNFAQPDNCLHRFSLRLDGFTSVTAPHSGGELITKPLTFTGTKLVLNMATSAAGGISIELQDADGKPLPDYTLALSKPSIGNSLNHEVVWRSGKTLAALAGKAIRLRFVMRDAKIFSMQFQ
jgi:hypothetical protein